jgi:hypothetical protein
MSISDLNHDHIKLRWQPDLNNDMEHLVFSAHHDTTDGSHLNATSFDPTTRKHGFVTRELWEVVKTIVKQNVEGKYTVLTLNFVLGLFLNLVASLPILSLGLLISMDSLFALVLSCFVFGISSLHGISCLFFI